MLHSLSPQLGCCFTEIFLEIGDQLIDSPNELVRT